MRVPPPPLPLTLKAAPPAAALAAAPLPSSAGTAALLGEAAGPRLADGTDCLMPCDASWRNKQRFCEPVGQEEGCLRFAIHAVTQPTRASDILQDPPETAC